LGTTAKGRARHEALFNFLLRYPMATTTQLAELIWAGDQQLARQHLLRFTRDGLVRRVPHPLYRNGAYVYSARTERRTAHSQKVLHHLQAVDLHIAVTRQLGRYGARVIPELPWGEGLIPDQTVLWRESAWAIEHHLTGSFAHASDYLRFIEEEEFRGCHWWREGMKVGLVVITAPAMADHVTQRIRSRLAHHVAWRVASLGTAIRDPGGLLKMLRPGAQAPNGDP
jgi:hypothetical protein